MSKVMICLISGERMQNILPLYQQGAAYERVYGLVSRNQEAKFNEGFKKAFDLIQEQRAGDTEWILWDQPVDPADPDSTRQACIAISQKEAGHELCINFTGGMKPMSIGAYLAGLDLGAKLLYVDTQAEQFRFSSGQFDRCIPFDLQKFNIQDVLAWHGAPINEEKTAEKQFGENELALGEGMLSDKTGFLDLFCSLETRLKDGFNKAKAPISLPKNSPLSPALALLAEHAFIAEDGSNYSIPKSARPLLSGRWLELYTYTLLRQNAGFMDVQAQQVPANFDEDEIDVMALCHGKVAIIECKSGNLDGGVGGKALDRLYTHRQKATGMFGVAFLAVTNQVRDTLVRRVKNYQLNLVCKESLHRIDEIVLQRLSSKGR